MVIRWFWITLLAYLGTVTVACIAGVSALAISPEFIADRLEADPSAPLLRPVLWKSFELGSLVAILLAPGLGLGIVRMDNETVRSPEEDKRWWVRAHKAATIQFSVILASGVALCVLALLAALATGHPAAQVRWSGAQALVYGTLLGGVVVFVAGFAVRLG
jgi:hypothetical protein